MISKDKYIDISEQYSKENCSNILFIGDIHGEFGEVLLNCTRHPNTLQIYCGDVGMGFYKTGYYTTTFAKINKRALKHHCIIIFVRGNHDNPMYFYDNIEGWNPSIYSNIWMSQDWQMFGTPLGNILCSGGAISVDRSSRIEGKSWWKFEEIDYQPFNDIIKSLEGRPIDIMVTHTAPISFSPIGVNKAIDMGRWNDEEVIEKCRYEREYLDDFKNYLIDNNIAPKCWFYGHFHKHYYTGSNDIVGYGLGINDIKEYLYDYAY